MPLLSNFFLILCCNGALFDSFMACEVYFMTARWAWLLCFHSKGRIPEK